MSRDTYFTVAAWSTNILEERVIPYFLAFSSNYIKLCLNMNVLGNEGWVESIKLLEQLITYPYCL